ncbi:MAG: flagellar brake domain-containing protein [Acidobacteriota bacterium]
MDTKQSFSGSREIFKVLPPGLPMLFQFSGQKSSYRTSYVGTSPGDAVIMQLPMNPGVTRLLAEAYSIVVRFVHDGQAYGFESHFVAALRKPLPLLFVTYPNRVHQVSVRACERLAILERAVLLAGGTRLEGVLTDVSCGGCKIKLARSESSLALAAGSEALVEFSMSMEENVPIALKGMLVEVDNEGKKVKCRMTFAKEQEKELSLLTEFLQFVAQMLKD